MNPYHKYINDISVVSESTFDKFSSFSVQRNVPANTVISESGAVPLKAFLLLDGVLRAYITTESGKFYNKRLYSPVSFAGPLSAMVKKTPSRITYECLTDCEIFEIDFVKGMELCANEQDAMRLYTRILEKAFIAYEERTIDFMTLDATQRYGKLLLQIPNIEELIPQYQIASYLNITPVQLSRIRKKLIKG